MATTKMQKVGYGQVEPNRLTAQRTKEVYAQLPLDSNMSMAENGMALVYNQVAKKVTPVTTAGEGIVCLVMSEIILEDERYQLDRDFAVFNREETTYQVAIPAYPRLYGLHVGDTFTTNTVKITSTYAETEVPAGTSFIADTDGYWAEAEGVEGQLVAQVVSETTMPDGQRGLKLTIVKIDQTIPTPETPAEGQ